MKYLINKIIQFILKLSIWLIKKIPNKFRPQIAYNLLHQYDVGYINNNWLLPELNYLSTISSGNLLEIGCGNGKFIKEALQYFKTVFGIDLVLSNGTKNILDETPRNFEFIQANLNDAFPKLPSDIDLVVSADVLEHFNIPTLTNIIKSIDHISKSYHKIACYDDGISHITIMPPEKWLIFFKSINQEYQILKTEKRNNNINHQIVTISKGL